MTGFRVAYGGAQELFGIKPDLTTLGKIVGGGLPVGAYGGRAEIMDHILPAGPVFQAGTLVGNPLATAAGIATLEVLRDEPALRAAGTARRPARRRARPKRPRRPACRTRRPSRQHAHVVLQCRAGHRLALGQPVRYQGALPDFSGA